MLLAVLFGFIFAANAVPVTIRHEEFANYKLTHGKQYANLEEERMRLQIFSENLKKIEDHNKLYENGMKTYTLGVNQFTDMTPEEFVKFLTLQGPPPNNDNATVFKGYGSWYAPESMDWREYGAVTGVKNQGQCGSCWSFSATGAVEGAYFKSSGRLVSLSEQNLVDCDMNDNGCQGGMMQNAFAYIERNGIALENNYPYIGQRGSCRYQPGSGLVSIRGYQNVYQTEDTLVEAVGSIGPISIAVDATYFQHYSGGIFYEPGCSSSRLNHGVLAIGYGTEGQYDYWLIKNSWGASWGEEGYIRIIRNYNNHCGVASNPSYPIV